MAADDLTSADVSFPALAEPTRVRYGVLAYLCTLSFILYIDRNCIGKAAPAMQEDLGISKTLMGFVFGAFTVAYGLFEVPTGRLGDRYGSRGVLTRIVLWWSLFTALTGCVWSFTLDSGYEVMLPGVGVGLPLLLDSFVLLLIIRFLFGAGEAGALPNTARVLARWFPPGKRGPAQGLINTSMLIGGAATPVLAAYLMKHVGWRWSFLLFASLGLVWAAAFYFWFRDDPADHPDVNEAERRLIAAKGAPVPLAEHHPPVPWSRVLASANIWLMGGVITCGAFVSYLYFFWYPTYLEKGRGVGRIPSGWLSSLVLTGGAIGCILGGYLHDAVLRRTQSRRWSRRLIGCTGYLGAALLLVAGVQCESAEASALFTALASCSASATLASWWAVVTEISGAHIGALFGLMNSLGVPGAVASQLFFGSFADWREELGYTGRDQWDPGFYVCACVFCVGAMGWLFIDATKSVVEAPGETDASPEKT
jgi:ACS family glucarate transporter-like MFS transporter